MFFRSVKVQVNQSLVPVAPQSISIVEFFLEGQVVEVALGQDNFDNITTHGFLGLFLLFALELGVFNFL